MIESSILRRMIMIRKLWSDHARCVLTVAYEGALIKIILVLLILRTESRDA